jgi:hypothetical protein
LGEIYNTDKSPISNMEFKHSYTILYDFLFGKIKYDNIKIGEIGIWENASIKCFREYFPNAEIHGFEKIYSIIENSKKDNIKETYYYYMDGEKPDTIIESFEKSGGNFDIIIDDGSHVFEHQVNVILNSPNYLKPGGMLIIEDIFKSISEEEFQIKIKPIEKYFHNITFIETEHKLQYTGVWDNDKLLILHRNDIK